MIKCVTFLADVYLMVPTIHFTHTNLVCLCVCRYALCILYMSIKYIKNSNKQTYSYQVAAILALLVRNPNRAKPQLALDRPFSILNIRLSSGTYGFPFQYSFSAKGRRIYI